MELHSGISLVHWPPRVELQMWNSMDLVSLLYMYVCISMFLHNFLHITTNSGIQEMTEFTAVALTTSNTLVDINYSISDRILTRKCGISVFQTLRNVNSFSTDQAIRVMSWIFSISGNVRDSSIVMCTSKTSIYILLVKTYYMK